MSNLLPNPKQTWAHSTTSFQALTDALNDPKITAIETDILMGYDVSTKKDNGDTNTHSNDNDDDDDISIPIMAHPPERQSDLSFETFMKMTTATTTETETTTSTTTSTTVKKHLKLDLKEIKALDPILKTLSKTIHTINPSQPQNNNNNNDDDDDDNHQSHKTIYLNADIIKGPGMRNDTLPIPADDFLKPIMTFLKEEEKRQHVCAFSLGWKTDCRSFTGYTDEDVDEMKKIIDDYELLKFSQGVVLAINARVLYKNLKPFDSILKEYPQVQLLIWTGTGEPPISESKIDGIKSYFETNGYIDQIGFDCQIAPSYLRGAFYDKAVEAVGVFWNVKRYLISSR